MQGVQRTFLFVDTNEHAYGSSFNLDYLGC